MKCVHLDKLCYRYLFSCGHSNTTFQKNKSIQDHVKLCQQHYDLQFQEMNCRREKALQAKGLTIMDADKITQSPKPVQAPVTEKKPSTWSVVVLDWNTQNVTTACLKSVREAYPSAEIILVQNGRPFDTELATKTIKLETNIGFAAGCNRGAMEATGDNILFLNSDAMISKGTLDVFDKYLEGEKVGAVGPYSNQAKEPQGNVQMAVAPRVVNTLSGFCLAMRRPIFEQIGGFDSQFCNFEDDDLCNRLSLAGYMLVIADTWVFHQEHTSFKANNTDYDKKIEDSRRLYNTKWPKIKIVAITLNEINSLPGFFDQFKNITHDALILDSGSTDGTVEWAKQHGIAVETRKFDDFSSQRNAALEAGLGKNGEWVLMLDPDERLDKNTLEHIHALTRCDKYDIYLSPLNSLEYDGVTQKSWVPKAFLFRNKPHISWINTEHEKLIGSMKQALVKNALITHHLALHDPERRKANAVKYGAKDASLDSPWPILNYEHRDDDRIDKVYVGPTVSVIIPTFKRRELCAKAIESVQKQDYLNTEIVIVGDDDPQFVKYVNVPGLNLPKNHGAGGAEPRNYGIMCASGAYIAYCDDDNELKPNHISSLLKALEKNNADFAFASLDLDGKTLPATEPVRGQIDTSAVLHKKVLVSKFGWWRDRTADGYCHDAEFFGRFVKGGAKWVATGLPTVDYNIETSGQPEFLRKLMEGLK